ncbi:hypothetical protein HELRODRAFT_165758 [Helobdella robusta]|uniref:Helicase C-terminal domain-containing protein n=1 Tax=Helobdella robusta TaxID=6412 RepID=T1EX94_HELRO|nr:hypothetical protein HELRODRAFT_165758 [Helobdella robusta]ESN91697.1 hypothetical protein HELRODRAFT_165758 [Helobdella robusta]
MLNTSGLDGGTAGVDREKLINQFNDYNNTRIHLFLLSTRAGCLGINLIGACRVVIFDASWNPCHDCQAVCRVYRYGQNKCCFVYRLVSDNTMEKNIYDRQINKQGISDRVVDELNPQNLLSKKQVDMLMRCEETESPEVNLEGCEEKCSDPLLIQVIKRNKHWLTKSFLSLAPAFAHDFMVILINVCNLGIITFQEPFTHESLLLDRKDQKLTRHEKRLAKQGYEMEKKMSSLGIRQSSLYGKSLDGVSMVRFGQRPVASVRPMMSTNIRGGLAPRGVTNNQFRAPGLKPGVSVQQIQTTTDIIIPGTNTVSDSAGSKIPAGEKVLVIKTPKGVYIRTSHGKIFAVRTAPKPGATTAAASTATASAATNSSALSGTTTTQARGGTISSAKKVDDDDKVMEVVDDDDDEDGVSIVKDDTSKSNANNVSNNNTASPLSQQAAAGDSSKVATTATATTTISAFASVASSASSVTAQSNISANIVLTTTNNPTIRIAEDSYSIGNHSKYNCAATASTATALASSTTTGNKNILPVASTSAQHPSLASPTTTPMPKQQQPQDATGSDKQQTNCNNNINSSNNNNNSFMNNSNKFSSKSTNPLPVRPVLPMPNNNNNNNNNSNNNFSNNNNNNANKNTKKTKDKGDFLSPSSSSSHHATKETGSVTPFNNNPSTTKPVAQPQPVANNSASSQQQQQHNSFMDWNKRPPGSSSSSASSASMMNKDFDSLFGIPPPSPGHLASSFDGGMGGLFPNYLKPSADPMSGFPSSFSSNHSSSLADRHSSKSNFTANPFSSSSSSSSLHHPVPMTPSYLHPGMNPYAMPNPYSWMTSPMWMDAQHQLPHFPGSDYGSNPAADAFGLAGSISGSGGSSLGSDLLGMDNFPGSGGSSGVGGPSASVGSGLAGFGGPFEDRSFSSLLMGEDENASRNRSNNNNSSNSSSSGSNRNNSSSNNNMNSPGYRQSSYPHPSPMTGYPYHNPYSPYPPMPQPGSYYPGPGSSSHSATPGMGRGSYLGPTSMHYPPQHPGPFMQSPYDFGRNILQGSSKKEGFDEK